MIRSIQKYYFLISIFTLFINNAYSTHIVGGDFKITMSSNTAIGADYFFQLKLFRDDVNAGAVMPNTANIGVYDAVTHFQVSTILLNRTTNNLVNLGDPCYTPDPNVVRIQEGVFVNNTSKFLPNNPNGYYVQYENYARNAIIDNIANPGATGITIFAMFPDPALGQNSSPDFGIYPSDAYFCVNNTKLMTFPVVDPDGDSLVYSLVDPMNGTIAGGGTSAGGGAYPFYPSCVWQAGFSLANIVGGNPAMSIDPINGVISATPANLGFFVYTVRVEEYRNGLKIGEVRRDVQYASLACTIAVPPVLAVNGFQGTFPTYSLQLDVGANDTSCFDIDAAVIDPNDSVYLKLTSPNFDLLTNYQSPNILAGSTVSYDNWEDVIGNTVVFNPNIINNAYYGNLSNVYLRYCWVPQCNIIDSVFNITFDIYAVDVDNSACAGITSNQATLGIGINQSANDSTLIHNITDSFCLDYTLNGQTYNSAGTYNQILTNSLGCDSTIVLDLTQSSINVISQITDESCSSSNGVIELSANGANSGYIYELDGVTMSSNIFDNLSAGTYSVQVTSADGCSTSQSIDINDVDFEIDTVIITPISCNGLCDGLIEINSPSAVYYSIQGPQNSSDSSSLFDSLCFGNYMVFAENINGCLDSQIVVLNDPLIITSSIVSDTTVCINGSVTSFMQNSGGTGNITVNWSNGTFGDTISWVATNDTSITVFGIDSVGCSSDTLVQNIQTFPPLSILMSSDTFICNSDSVSIFGLVSGGIGSGYVFNWDSSLSDTSHHFVTPLTSQNYTLTVNDGCETPQVTGSTFVTVYPLPVVDFTADIYQGCIPLTVSFNETFSTNFGTCSWDFGDLNNSTLCDSVSNTYNSVGCWDVSLTYSDTTNCTRTTIYDSLICTFDNPVSDFEISPTEVSLFNDYATFTSTSSSNSIQFLWELGDSNDLVSSNTEDFRYSFSGFDLGSHPICLTVENDIGCLDSLCKTITVKDDFIFYIPNSFTPDGDGRNENFGPVIKGASDDYQFAIYNRWGELIFERTDNLDRWNGEHLRTGIACSQGVYVWKVTLNDEINNEKKEYIGNVTLLR